MDTKESVVEDRAWSGGLDDLEDAIVDLRRQLAERDSTVGMLARERHALERALDRYVAASDAVARCVDALLRNAAPRPRH